MGRDEAPLAEAVRTRREALGLTQDELAVHANVSRSTIQNVEAGKAPRPVLLGRIAHALGTDIATLRHGGSPDGAGPPPDTGDRLAQLREQLDAALAVLNELEREQRRSG